MKTGQVFAEDLNNETMRKDILDMAQKVFNTTITSGKNFSSIAKILRNDLDKKYEPAGWCCVVGTKFATGVSHEMKTYM
jgi:hypothetical protein